MHIQKEKQRLWIRLIVCWIMASCTSFGCASKAQVEESIVKVIIDKESDYEEPVECEATGTIIHVNRDGRGYILTDHHAVKRLFTGDVVKVQCKEGRSMYAKLDKFDENLDLALLQSSGTLPRDISQLYFAKLGKIKERIREPANVFVYGYPVGDYTISTHSGRIQGQSGHRLKFRLADDITLGEGQSGSPLLDAQDRIVGIVRAKDDEYQYAIHGDIVRTVLEGWEIDLKSPKWKPPSYIGVPILIGDAGFLYGAVDSFWSAKKAHDRRGESATYEEYQRWDRECEEGLLSGAFYLFGVAMTTYLVLRVYL